LQASESDVKDALREIVGEPFEQKDWGGEQSDLYTSRVKYQGKRIATAMLLKRPAIGPVLYPPGLGKRGDQSLRLSGEDAELLIVQFNGEIAPAVDALLREQGQACIARCLRTFVCVIDGPDTARLLRAFGYA